MALRYLQHNEINKQKWDATLHDAANGLIYAESFYLDTMCPGWDAIVSDDYKTVMPLPWRKKYGFKYLFQPFLTPQLGLFGENISVEIVNEFLEFIPGKFKLRDLSLNYSNPAKHLKQKFNRSNYILSLNDSYQKISDHYLENIKRNLSKAIKAGCIVKKNIPIGDVINICKKEYPKFTKTETGLFEKLAKVYSHYHQLSRTETYGVYINDQLLSVGAFLFSKQRAYYWLVSNEPESRQYGSSPMLIDAFIQAHANNNIVLDFEGSDDEGVADFYKKFGASLESYTTIYQNRLPFPFNLLKSVPAHYRNLIREM